MDKSKRPITTSEKSYFFKVVCHIFFVDGGIASLLLFWRVDMEMQTFTSPDSEDEHFIYEVSFIWKYNSGTFSGTLRIESSY